MTLEKGAQLMPVHIAIPVEREWPAHLQPIGAAQRKEWKCSLTARDVQIGRAREAQLIAEAERQATLAFEARREQRKRDLEKWAAYRAETRARLPHA